MSFIANMRTLATTSLIIALLLVLQGCDALENTEPATSISQEVALTTPSAIAGLRASMYNRFHAEAMSTDWLLGPSSQADDTFFRLSQGRHQGLNLNLLGSGIGTGAYDNFYDTINDANLLINGIEEGVIPEARANKLEAEGRFIRALVYHHAARIFGYEPGMTPNSGAGSGFDLSVELRLEPTTALQDAESLARSTAAEVYDQLVTDLETATSLFSNLPAEEVEGSPFFPSAAAAQALLARVHLYQQAYSPADQAAQNAIDLAGGTFGSQLATPSQIGNIFDETAGNPEAIFTIDTDPSTESAGVNNALSAYTSEQWLAQIPSEALMSLYEEGDARVDAWYGAPCINDVTGSAAPGCEDINTGGFELQKYDAEQGTFADDYIHLRIAEMVLIQAEARLNTGGASTAISRLNDLRTQRGASELDPANFDQESALDEILDERRRELVAEGHRYFDLKRLGRDIAKNAGKLSDPSSPAPVPYEDFRILDDLPENQLGVNELLVQNPGYN